MCGHLESFFMKSFTRGRRFPYIDMNNGEVRSALEKQRYRMPCPDKCPEKLYGIMLDCWSEKPNNRPTFETLHRLNITLVMLNHKQVHLQLLNNCCHLFSIRLNLWIVLYSSHCLMLLSSKLHVFLHCMVFLHVT